MIAPRARDRRTRTSTLVALAAAALLAGAGPASAQFEEGPSVLSLLPVEGSLSLGDEIEGALRAGDYLAGGRRVLAYEYEGGQGDPLTVDLVSEDFDAYLVLVGPDGREAESDDDGGGACHARISTFLEAAGTYRIVASSLSGQTGSFTLRVDDRQRPPAPGDCGSSGLGSDVMAVIDDLEPEGTLSLAGAAEGMGELTADDTPMPDGSRVDAWLVEGEPGQTVVIDLVSRAFDAVLVVLRPDGEDFDFDDDSGGACNSRITVALGDGPRMAIVNSFGGGTGAYTLRVSAEAGPVSTGPCP